MASGQTCSAVMPFDEFLANQEFSVTQPAPITPIVNALLALFAVFAVKVLSFALLRVLCALRGANSPQLWARLTRHSANNACGCTTSGAGVHGRSLRESRPSR